MLAGDVEGDGPSVAKRNPYAEAADPERYRIADAPLFTCAAHTEACVLCTTAGKNGRNGRTAAVGATLFWLTCPYLNALIARLEGHRCVQAVTEAMKRHDALKRAHVASHDCYVARARSLLSGAQWSFFESHFLTCDDARLHKFGNAAVSHAADMKCLHALVAQTLAGAANPVGSLILNYVLFLYQLTCVAEKAVAEVAGQEEETRLSLRAVLDSAELFVNFTEAFVQFVLLTASHSSRAGMSGSEEVETPTLTIFLPEPRVFEASEMTYVWQNDASFSALSPDACARALHVLTFLEGKPPRRHKKHRIN